MIYKKRLDLLERYCNKWGLHVYTEKTKIVFRRCGGLYNNEKWAYKGIPLEIVDNIDYFEIFLNHTGNFALNQETMVGKGLKALNCLLYNTKYVF